MGVDVGTHSEDRDPPLELGETEQPVNTERCGHFSAAEALALHRRVLAARDLDVDPDPTDLAAAHQLNAAELAEFDRTWSEEALKLHR